MSLFACKSDISTKEKTMAGRNGKYKPGQVRRIALNRIRVHRANLPAAYSDVKSEEELREAAYKFGKTRSKLYHDIEPIKVMYVPKYSTRQFVLVDGGDNLLKAQKLGANTILCSIVGEHEEPPCDLSMWFD